MFLLDRDDPTSVVLSPSDLRLAAGCEFALVRELDVLLGRADRAVVDDDDMLGRLAELGDAHEQGELLRLRAAHPGAAVRQFDRPRATRDALTAAAEQTWAALADPAIEVVAQACFFDGHFLGYADFLERTPAGWLVSDTKLARHESVAALLQIGAYAAALEARGLPLAPTARLVLGSGVAHDFALADLLPAYRARRGRLDALVADHLTGPDAAGWGDPRWWACGRCAVCEEAVVAERDLLLVAGMRLPTRRRLREGGVGSIDALAAHEGEVDGIRGGQLDRLRAQARLQLTQLDDPEGGVRAEVHDASAARALPAPNEGDVFFDFEGDPLWVEPGSARWGLEYLFGLIEADPQALAEAGPQGRFRAFWAHDRVEEKQALVDFVAYLHDRRRRWPGLHVYHYAAYETAALKRLAQFHGVCEDDIDQFLREGLFVDLYAVVRSGVRVSQRSYSIKKLEPLYMGARGAEVKKGDDSIVVYEQFRQARIEGRDDEARRLIDSIAAYNREDCISTRLLRDWLLGLFAAESAARAAGLGLAGGAAGEGAGAGDPGAVREPATPSAERLAALALEQRVRDPLEGTRPGTWGDDQRALSMAASLVLFNAREDKPMWWAHFDRLATSVREWRDEGGVLVFDRVEATGEWVKPNSRSNPRRPLLAQVEPGQGQSVAVGATFLAVYTVDAPGSAEVEPGHLNGTGGKVTVASVDENLDASGRVRLTLTLDEMLPKGASPHDDLPVALVTLDHIRKNTIDAALAEVAEGFLDAWPGTPVGPAADLLLRRPPRLGGAHAASGLPGVGVGGDRFVEAIDAAVRALDGSYLAVQGPPGTGKTHVGAHVIARLVRDLGWRVGVCSQGHAAVDNLLAGVVKAGVPREQVGKHTPGVAGDSDEVPWTAFGVKDDLPAFLARHATDGCVVGGTAWDFTHLGRVGRGELDLLVIDEAGQYSLAWTLATSTAARNLLLLGDPQQLPQVSQGTHPDPVDTSVLSWLCDGAPVLPERFGYFLETSWRMHPALCAPVSRLAYAGRLRSRSADEVGRWLDGLAPGVHVRTVDHEDNVHSSPEEAAAVVALIRDELTGLVWLDPEEVDAAAAPASGRPLGARDVLVITPYNAQVGVLRRALDDAGLGEVRVGTVDKFQGQEAPVAILSMACSSPSSVSRGVGFLLDRHRLNVALSRGKWAAFIVQSGLVGELAPRSARELVSLGAYLGLLEQAVTSTGPSAGASI